MNKYQRRIVGKCLQTGEPVVVIVDVYNVIDAFGITCPARAHAVKKVLATGERGHKDFETDVKETKESMDRAATLKRDRELMTTPCPL